MYFREYVARDRTDCLAIIRSNTPDFFAEHEVSEFEEFLHDPDGAYYVVEVDEAIAACGGWSARPDGSVSLCWGMVRRTEHRRGIGSYLLRERLHAIRKDRATATRVVTLTSQHSRQFFERHGFVVVDIELGGLSPALDAVSMSLENLSNDPDNRTTQS